jgi:predicted MPP superfamily phosphohydrolase
VVAVLGNHDYESGETDQVKGILTDAGVTLLDGDALEIDGVGFAGAKGLGGGFGQRRSSPGARTS